MELIDKIEAVKKEIQHTKEITNLLKQYTETVKTLNNYMKFVIEYMDILPEHEIERFLLLMDEFGISEKGKK